MVGLRVTWAKALWSWAKGLGPKALGLCSSPGKDAGASRAPVDDKTPSILYDLTRKLKVETKGRDLYLWFAVKMMEAARKSSSTPQLVGGSLRSTMTKRERK